MKDHIVEAVRRIRDEHAAHFNYDLDAIFFNSKRLEAESNKTYGSCGPRRIAVPLSPYPPVCRGP